MSFNSASWQPKLQCSPTKSSTSGPAKASKLQCAPAIPVPLQSSPHLDLPARRAEQLHRKAPKLQCSHFRPCESFCCSVHLRFRCLCSLLHIWICLQEEQSNCTEKPLNCSAVLQKAALQALRKLQNCSVQLRLECLCNLRRIGRKLGFPLQFALLVQGCTTGSIEVIYTETFFLQPIACCFPSAAGQAPISFPASGAGASSEALHHLQHLCLSLHTQVLEAGLACRILQQVFQSLIRSSCPLHPSSCSLQLSSA